MKKRLIMFLLIFFGFCTTNYAYTDLEVINNLNVWVKECTNPVKPGQGLRMVVQFSKVLEEKEHAKACWYRDGKPIPNYSSENFTIAYRKQSQILLNIDFYEGMPSGTTITFKVTLAGVTRSFSQWISFENYSDEYYEKQNINTALKLVKPVEIDATITRWTYIYSDKHMTNRIAHFIKGDKVKLINHYLTTSAYVRYNNKYYWVPYSALSISTKNYTVYEDFSDKIKEGFVNGKKYTSDTDYLVWVNIERQKVNVFLKYGGRWNIEKTFTCATGANRTFTPNGIYKYTARDNIWRFDTYYVKPILYFDYNRAMAFHSRLYYPNGALMDARIGTPVSHGCIRMYDSDVNWMKDYLPFGTTVVIY